ncbi:TetR/AcrR family transcriptional regulator [Nocardioides sp. NPDC006303]|uniref:TetR/AcrR family transcriptional regulator n=1 Tax=Nocardioides sp. NPDC006303 TaxID=3156747 RepID=UPI0033A87984
MTTAPQVTSTDQALLRFLVAAKPSQLEGSGTTRRQILETSIRLFAEDGYAASSMRIIADACGIRAPSIYEHFGSKPELLIAAMTEVLSDFQTFIRQVIDIDLPHAEQLEHIIKQHATWQVKFAERAGAWDSLAAAHTLEKHLDPEQVERFNGLRQLYLDVVTSLVAEAFPGNHPVLRARALMSLCDRTTSWAEDSSAPVERLADQAWVLAQAVLTADV